MLRVNQIKVNIEHSRKDVISQTAKILHVDEQDILSLDVVRSSVDARKKPDIYIQYSVDIRLNDEKKVLKRFRGKEQLVAPVERITYQFPVLGKKKQENSIVIVGAGPAGLFCGYYLALHGYCPIILERGKDVDARQRDVEDFWSCGVLNPESNVQFGEGGAGTFSDGKLNTLVKDKYGRNRAVLETFVKFGANPKILYDYKPHIGTDVLRTVVKNMREEIIRLGGEVRFEHKVTGIKVEQNAVKGVYVNGSEYVSCSHLVMAIGHSARDTFYMLHEQNIPMEAKSFAVGLRVEHPQKLINQSQYGVDELPLLGAAPYKVAAKTSLNRGVYSFCMCPGGYVVNASSEPGHTAVNGMSYSDRGGENANSAIIVSVCPDDYPHKGVLAGIEFQRMLEKRAYILGNGKIPVQHYGAFKNRVLNKENVCEEYDSLPQCKGAYVWTDLSGILPEECNRAFVEGMEYFDRIIPGFASNEVTLLGVESRTSSPVRMLRQDNCQSAVSGIYPCGEGAGYAGGITSAAMDGMKVAEAIATVIAPMKTPEMV